MWKNASTTLRLTWQKATEEAQRSEVAEDIDGEDQVRRLLKQKENQWPMKQYSHYSHCFFAKDGAEGPASEEQQKAEEEEQRCSASHTKHAGICRPLSHTQICTQICIHACMPQWYIIWVCHRCWNNTPRYTSAVYACVQTWVYLRQNREVGFERYSEWIRATKES